MTKKKLFWDNKKLLCPNVVLIDTQGKTHIIRKKEDIETFNRQEVVPDYLKDWKKK